MPRSLSTPHRNHARRLRAGEAPKRVNYRPARRHVRLNREGISECGMSRRCDVHFVPPAYRANLGEGQYARWLAETAPSSGARRGNSSPIRGPPTRTTGPPRLVLTRTPHDERHRVARQRPVHRRHHTAALRLSETVGHCSVYRMYDPNARRSSLSIVSIFVSL